MSREEKQQYLCKEVLEKGYDPEEFVDFMNNVIQVGVDVDVMTFKELETAVQAFKAKKQEDALKVNNAQAKPQVMDEPLIESLEIITNTEVKPPKPKIITYEKYGNVQEQELSRTLKCLKFSPKFPVETPPKIEVSDPQRKSTGGLFGIGAVSFLLFKITTFDFKWEVRRRYSDFQWLRAVICKFYPTYVVPPIPKKNAKKRTQRDLEKRMRILTYFLNDIALIPEIFQSKYVTGFLNMTNESQFEDLKKEGTNKEVFETITSLETTSGTVDLKLNLQNKAYVEEIEKFLNGAEGLYKEITRSGKALQNLYIDETNTLYRMGNMFADLHTLLRDMNHRVPVKKQNTLNDTYIFLNNMTVEWGNIIRNQHAYLQKNFNTFFKYVRNEIISIKQLFQRVNDIEAEYFKNKAVLDKKKDKIFQTGDMSRWEVPKQELSSVPKSALSNKIQAFKIMLPKESFELEKQRLKYAFYQTQFVNNSWLTLDKSSTKFCDNFKEFAIKIKVNGQQLTQLWTQIATNFANPKKKMTVQKPVVQSYKEQEIEDG